eukprot:87580_1
MRNKHCVVRIFLYAFLVYMIYCLRWVSRGFSSVVVTSNARDNIVKQIEMDISLPCFEPIVIQFSDKYEYELCAANDNVFMRKYGDKITFLVGIGSKKVGSTYFTTVTMPIALDWMKQDYIIFDETELWRHCLYADRYRNEYNCTISDYLKRFDNRLKDKKGRHSKGSKLYLSKTIGSTDHMLLYEDTASYIRTFHASYFLVHLSYKYTVMFYVIIRNPITRVYSHVYHDWVHALPHHRKGTLTPELASQNIISAVQDFATEHPLWYIIWKAFEITNETQGNNDDMNATRITELYEHAFYQYWPDRAKWIPPIFISCYLPQIMVWMHLFNVEIPHQFGYKPKLFADHFKIILTEEIWRDPINKSIALIAWSTQRDTQKDHDMFGALLNTQYEELVHHFDVKTHKNILGAAQGKKLHFAPRTDPLQLDFAPILTTFYADMQQRLLWFLRDHPELKL